MGRAGYVLACRFVGQRERSGKPRSSPLPPWVINAAHSHCRLCRGRGGEAPKGARSKAVWSKPGLAGTVKFLRGEDHLRHATLTKVYPFDPKEALNRQKAQREAVREMLDRLKGRE